MTQKIILKTVEDYKNHFKKEFVEKTILTCDGFSVIFKEWHFNHMFFRNKQTDKAIFDKRLANDMLFIKDIITGNITWVEIYEQYNAVKNRRERSHILLYQWLYVILLFDNIRQVYHPITAYYRSKQEIINFKQKMSQYQIF